jgi:hypothetical protein
MHKNKRKKVGHSSTRAKRSGLQLTRNQQHMESVNIRSAVRNRDKSVRVRVRLKGEAARLFDSLLRLTDIRARKLASSLLSVLLLEHPEIPRLTSKSTD